MKTMFRTVNMKGDVVEAGELRGKKRIDLFHKCLGAFGSCTGSEPSESGYKTWFFSRCDKSAGHCGVTITSVWVESV